MPTTATPNLMLDPGFLWYAPAGTAFPTLGGTVVGSVYTFQYAQTIEAITVAEFADPVKWRTTGRQGSMAFNMADFTLTQLQRAMNGGVISTDSGSGTTLSSKWVPPVIGSETRAALLWQSLDGTMRIFMYQTVQVNEMQSAFKKAPDYAVLPCEFRFEIDASSRIFEVHTAGTARLGL